jgi:hypothetical protein
VFADGGGAEYVVTVGDVRDGSARTLVSRHTVGQQGGNLHSADA